MSFVRTVKRENPFVQLDKNFIGDGNLSLKATGLLTYFLSKPDGWQIRLKDVQNRFTDGETSIRSGIKELIEVGYINRYRERDESGKFGDYVYEVYERVEFNPKRENQVQVDEKDNIPKRGFPEQGNPEQGNPEQGNHVHSNNDLSDIDLNNNKHNYNNLNLNQYEDENIHNHDTTKLSNHDTTKLSTYSNTNLSKTNKNNNNINNLNHNLENNNVIYDTLNNIDLPMSLKQKIKVMVIDKNLSLSNKQILDIENAYHYQIDKNYLVPDVTTDEYDKLNINEFSNTVIKMLESVKDIKNMNGLIKEWVHKAIEYKQQDKSILNFNSSGKELYNWLEQ